MYYLERNGYRNVTGLKREFAIEVDLYDEKEKLLFSIFEKSRVSETELFAIDLDTVIQLLSSFEGNQVYPKDKEKTEIFKEATYDIEIKNKAEQLPDEEFYLERKVKGFGVVKGVLRYENNKFVVKKGSYCRGEFDSKAPRYCKDAKIVNNYLQEDFECLTPSGAGWIVLGKSNNGKIEWKDKDGKSLAEYL